MNTSVTTVADYLTTPPTSPHRVRINFAASPDEPLAITGDPVGTAVGWLPLTRSDISRIEPTSDASNAASTATSATPPATGSRPHRPKASTGPASRRSLTVKPAQRSRYGDRRDVLSNRVSF